MNGCGMQNARYGEMREKRRDGSFLSGTHAMNQLKRPGRRGSI